MPDCDPHLAKAPPSLAPRSWTIARLRTSNGFAGSVAKLASGQFIAMIVPFLAAPILGRLYVPADYGAFALYVALASLLSVFATLQLQHAIIAEKSNRRAIQLIQLCALCAIVVAGLGLVLACALTIAHGWQTEMPTPRAWWFFLPLSILLLGLISSIGTLANRMAHYGSMAAIQVIMALATVIVGILAGLAGWGPSGLLAGYLSGQVAGAACFLVLQRQLAVGTPFASFARLVALFRRHRRFPAFTLPSELLGTFNQQLPIFALGALGANALTGAYSRSLQLVATPITLLGTSIGQVFREKASEDYRVHGTCQPLFRRTALVLFAVGLPSTILFSFLAPDIFALYLGPDWREAGEVARLLAPMLLLRLVASPLSTVFFFTESQIDDVVVMGGAFFVCGSLVLSSAFLFNDPAAVIIGFSAAYALIYLFQIGWSYRLAGGKPA